MSIKTQEDLEGMKEAGRIVRLALSAMEEQVRPGITTAELDAIGTRVLESHGARSAPAAFYGFPATTCISVNEEIVHGIPSERALVEGDLVKLDVTAEKNGYIADAAITVAVGRIPDQHRRLMECAERAFRKAMAVATAGRRVSEIGRAVEREVKRSGFRVVRELCGHGVGRAIHEEPSVPNFFDPGDRAILTDGLVIAVEPMIALGTGRAVQLSDGWTISTADGGRAAHYEQTVLITRGRPVLLTA